MVHAHVPLPMKKLNEKNATFLAEIFSESVESDVITISGQVGLISSFCYILTPPSRRVGCMIMM